MDKEGMHTVCNIEVVDIQSYIWEQVPPTVLRIFLQEAAGFDENPNTFEGESINEEIRRGKKGRRVEKTHHLTSERVKIHCRSEHVFPRKVVSNLPQVGSQL